MNFLITTLITLLAGTVLAVVMHDDPGFAVFGYGPWTVEMSLAVFAVIVALSFIASYFFIRLTFGVIRAPRALRNWFSNRKETFAAGALNKGLCAQAEGNWKLAEKRFLSHIKITRNPLINYLEAAKAAQAQGSAERRDKYLLLAHNTTANSSVAVEIAQAELLMDNGQLEQALATLTHLRILTPKNTHVLRLLSALLQRLPDWEQLSYLLPEMEQRKVLSRSGFEHLEKRVFRKLIRQRMKEGEASRVHDAWSRMPKRLKQDNSLLALYMEYSINHNDTQHAERLLREAISRSWHEDLVYLYGKITGENRSKQLATAESWLKEHATDPVLLLSLGRICLQMQLWGKARAYLETCTRIGQHPEAFHALAQLLEKLNDQKEAAKYYRKGLELAYGKFNEVKPDPSDHAHPPSRN